MLSNIEAKWIQEIRDNTKQLKRIAEKLDTIAMLIAVKVEADTPQADEIGDCNICRFAGCSECDDCINGSQWVRETEIDDLD